MVELKLLPDEELNESLKTLYNEDYIKYGKQCPLCGTDYSNSSAEYCPKNHCPECGEYLGLDESPMYDSDDKGLCMFMSTIFFALPSLIIANGFYESHVSIQSKLTLYPETFIIGASWFILPYYILSRKKCKKCEKKFLLPKKNVKLEEYEIKK